MRLMWMVVISAAIAFVVAAGTEPKAPPRLEGVSTEQEKLRPVDSPYVTGRNEMMCNSLASAERVAQLAQLPSEESAGSLNVDSAIDEVNRETGRSSCGFGSLRYTAVEQVEVIPSRNGMILFRVFKFSRVSSFKPESNDGSPSDWMPIDGGPADEYVVVPRHGPII